MKRRVSVIAGAAAIVGIAYWLLRSPSSAPPTVARRSTKIDVRGVKPGHEDAPPVEKPRTVLTESGWRPQTTRKTPREWIDPVSGAVNREILDAVPDPAAAAAEELKYRKSRLRLSLADAAAGCWTGGDSNDEIELEYTLVVDKEMIRADNVRVKTSSISDPTVERCIIDSVRDMRTPGDRIPDMHEDQGLIMSLHDLYDRNARDAQSRAASDDKPTPVDRPTARPPVR
jgi:hypothetical protein